jgi:hypothetical protein
MSSLVSSSIYSQNNIATNLKPSLSTSTNFQQQQQLLSQSFHGTYYTPSQTTQLQQNCNFPLNETLQQQKTSSTLALTATTVSTPTAMTTTTISIQQANNQNHPQPQQNVVYSRALSEPRYQSAPKTTSKDDKSGSVVETYDNISTELENNTIETDEYFKPISNTPQEHIYGVLENKDNKIVQKKDEHQQDDECNDNENLKLKLMQKQLFDLTNMIHSALMNGDLKQLAAIEQNLNKKVPQQPQLKAIEPNNDENQKINYKKNLNNLLLKIKELKIEYQTIKKQHENFNLNINESMKGFVSKLQVSLSSK